MKVYFIRHGESFDDVYNEYGSWSDRELTPHGIKTAFRVAEKLKKLNEKFDIVYTSPLKRSSQTAQVIASELNTKVEEDPYLIERNTYGLLSGVNKDLAIEEYPEMNAAFLEGAYIPASERYEDFVKRIVEYFNSLKKSKHRAIVCSTHGHVITVIAEEILGLVRNSVGNGCVFGIQISGNNYKIIHADGISFTKEKQVERGVALRKFKK